MFFTLVRKSWCDMWTFGTILSRELVIVDLVVENLGVGR